MTAPTEGVVKRHSGTKIVGNATISMLYHCIERRGPTLMQSKQTTRYALWLSALATRIAHTSEPVVVVALWAGSDSFLDGIHPSTAKKTHLVSVVSQPSASSGALVDGD